MDGYDAGWNYIVLYVMEEVAGFGKKESELKRTRRMVSEVLERHPEDQWHKGMRDACEEYLKSGAINSRGIAGLAEA